MVWWALNSFNGLWPSPLGLYLQTTTWLCNYSSTVRERKNCATCCQSATISTAVGFGGVGGEFACKCSVSARQRHFVACYRHFSAADSRFHSTSTFFPRVWMEAVQMPIKRSLLALNLPAFMPRAQEMERGLGRVTLLCVLIQRNACCCSPLITHEPFVCTPSPPPPAASIPPSHSSTLGPRTEVGWYWFIFLY